MWGGGGGEGASNIHHLELFFVCVAVVGDEVQQTFNAYHSTT